MIIPGFMLTLTSHLIHIYLSGVTWSYTWSGFISGLLSWVVMSGITVGIVARFYNYLLSRGEG